jgi:hypothetical protein
MWRWKALWKTINIQEKMFLGLNDYLVMLIKILTEKWVKIKLKVREVQGVLNIP